MKIAMSLITFVFLSYNVNSQGFLKKLKDRTMDKIQQKAEDKLLEELSERLANEAVKPINPYMDSLFAQSYEIETGESYDPQNAEKMNAFLEGLMGNLELPEEYVFDYKLEVALKDYGSKDEKAMYLFVSTSQDIFGMEQEQDDKKMFVVFDSENDAMVSYDQNKKERMAIPVNSAFMSMYSEKLMEEEMEERNFEVEKISKTKKILGYQSQGYKYKTSETESEAYISYELPFDWDDAFGTMLKQFAPNFYQDKEDYIMDGMLMMAETKRLEDGKKSEWKMKKIDEKTTRIVNADYTSMQFNTQ